MLAGIYLMDQRVAGYVPADLLSSTVSRLISQQLTLPHTASRVAFLDSETSVGRATLLLQAKLRANSRQRDTSLSRTDVKALETYWASCAQLLEVAIQVASNDEMDDNGCEVLYGRAGLLYVLHLLQAELASLHDRGVSTSQSENPAIATVASICSDTNVQAIVDDIMKRGKLGAREYQEELASLRDEREKAPPLMWRWHATRYIGVAHGVGETSPTDL